MRIFSRRPRLESPLPEEWWAWSPLAQDLWLNVMTVPINRSAIDDVIRRHAPEVVNNCTKSHAETACADNELEYYR